jgi:hypothetical protein
MRVKQTFWLIVLSAISVQSISSAPVPTFAEVQTKRIANPSIEVRDAQSLTSRTAGNLTKKAGKVCGDTNHGGEHNTKSWKVLWRHKPWRMKS